MKLKEAVKTKPKGPVTKPAAKKPVVSAADQIKHMKAKAQVANQGMKLKAKTSMALGRSDRSTMRTKADTLIKTMKAKSDAMKADNAETQKMNFHQRRHDYMTQLDQLRLSRLTRMYGGGTK